MRWRAAVLVLSLATALWATMAGAQERDILRISSHTVAVGEERVFTLRAHIESEPGLGAWTVDVTYEPDAVDIVACTPQEKSVCGLSFDEDTFRVTGASKTGISGPVVLASFTVQCLERESMSTLTPDDEVFANAIPDDPQDLDPTVEPGSVTCAQPTPTRTAQPQATAPPATAAATAAPAALPSAGGGAGGDDASAWVLAAALAGAALLSGAVLRARLR